MARKKFVGIQISPISFIDEGVETVLETLQERAGVNVLMIGTVSWLGLKAGRSISYSLDGWPDHGVPEPLTMQGGAYFNPHPAFYTNTFIKDFRAGDAILQGVDILEQVIPEAHRRGMRVMPELMEPLFKYAGHGSTNTVSIANLPQCLEVDLFGRHGQEPCTNHLDYRLWWHSMIEDQCRSYAIDGIMWCNERRSPLDQLIAGLAPSCFCAHCRREAQARGIDVEGARKAFLELYDFFQRARANEDFVDGALIEFLRVLLRNPEILIWERFWLERNKDLDRELYGQVKWCNADLEFGLNVWNRNHFNPLRKAQWPWLEQTRYADWVKPITYQHQSGQVYVKEMSDFHRSLLRDLTPGVYADHVQAAGAQRGTVGSAGPDRDGPRHLCLWAVCRRSAWGTGQGAGLHGDRGRRSPGAGRPGRLHPRHRLPQRAGDLPGGGARGHLCAQLCQHEAFQLGRCPAGAARTGSRVTMRTLYLADPAIHPEQLAAIRAVLPADWQLSDQPDAAAVFLTENGAIDAGMVARAGHALRLVVRLDTGHAALPADLAVPLADLPNTALLGVAEHALLLMMALSRQLFGVVAATQAQQWLPERSEPILTDQRRYTYNWIGLQEFGVLYRKTLGIVGLGLIGAAVAQRARAFGMRVLYTQRTRLDPGREQQLGVGWQQLDDLLAQSDFVSLHHRFQEEPGGNDKQIGARELALMKPTAYLINTARGRLVDEEALAAALASGQIAGAGLDVFRYEPLPPGHPFFALAGPRLILTPHVAGAPIAEARRTIADELVELLHAL
ncbi:MAG: NAD(P)-dependent oxidoreductase [Caldilinea sp.]